MPRPSRIEYPYGRPGDSFRRRAGDEKTTCVARYPSVATRLIANLPRGNPLRYDVETGHHHATGDTVDEFKLVDQMRRDGWKGGSGQNILIYVKADGYAYIAEGNHRLTAALIVGIPAVSVEVHYKGRSDEHHLLWPFPDGVQTIED